MESISGPFYFSFDSDEFPGKVLVRSVTFETKLYTHEEFLDRSFRLLDGALPAVKVLKSVLEKEKEIG